MSDNSYDCGIMRKKFREKGLGLTTEAPPSLAREDSLGRPWPVAVPLFAPRIALTGRSSRDYEPATNLALSLAVLLADRTINANFFNALPFW